MIFEEMGYSKKHSAEGGKESEGKKWVIAGIAIRAPLKSIRTARPKEVEEGRSGSTTPTSAESRIPEKFPCPPAPRKPRPTQMCHFEGVREFFNPPDLESVFVVRHVERAN